MPDTVVEYVEAGSARPASSVHPPWVVLVLAAAPMSHRLPQPAVQQLPQRPST